MVCCVRLCSGQLALKDHVCLCVLIGKLDTCVLKSKLDTNCLLGGEVTLGFLSLAPTQFDVLAACFCVVC